MQNEQRPRTSDDASPQGAGVSQRAAPEEMARKRDNLPPLPTGAARNKWEAHCRKLNLERQVTRQGNPEAYHAAAMLLGMKYSIRSHTFYKPREGYTDPATKHNLLFFHPDTLAPLTGIEVSQRRENIEEFGDAEHKNGS